MVSDVILFKCFLYLVVCIYYIIQDSLAVVAYIIICLLVIYEYRISSSCASKNLDIIIIGRPFYYLKKMFKVLSKKKYNLLQNIPHTCISHVLDGSSDLRSSGCIMIVLLFHDIVLRNSCLVRSLVRSHALTFNICFDLLWIK